ncbi:MAG: glutathione S-transferase family protein [Burkholderiales bacterium]|nr:glutathione S-transferase family protein [Burkholderiales bacterium]
MESIRIAGMRPVWGLPSPSPFCLKLETWLRFEGIPYSQVILNKPPQSKTGKVPYLLRADGSTLADSNVIIETLAKERGIDLGYGCTPEEQARAHAVLRMIEESLYFAAVWERWMDAKFWPTTREGYFGHLPAGLSKLIAGMIRKKVRTALHGQGISRHEPARIAAFGGADVKVLSSALGNRSFFSGERPGVVDASAYGTLANLLGFPESTPLKAVVEAHPNLVEFCRRIKSGYWREEG